MLIANKALLRIRLSQLLLLLLTLVLLLLIFRVIFHVLLSLFFRLFFLLGIDLVVGLDGGQPFLDHGQGLAVESAIDAQSQEVRMEDSEFVWNALSLVYHHLDEWQGQLRLPN